MTDISRTIKTVIGGVAGAVGLIQRDIRSRMTIVAFHRVNDVLPEDGVTCKSDKFDAFCAYFKKHFRVISLPEQVQGCASGEDMGGTLSITFDDGYLDNLEVAAPILKRHGLPATFFVTTGFIGSATVPFWDHDLPSRMGWMNWDQVRELAAMGFDIGSHTVSHINMKLADAPVIASELQASKRQLEEELRRDINLFAYPFGGEQDISDSAVELVRQAGYICCVSCYGGTNVAGADPFRLQRIGIAEWFVTPNQFGAEMLLGKL